MNCPVCGSAHHVIFQKAWRLFPTQGILGRIFHRAGVNREQSGYVTICAACATQLLVTDEGVKRVVPREVREREKREEALSNAKEGQERESKYPWRS